MVYTPTTWVNGSSPFINATNLQHIENQVATNTSDIATLQAGGGGGGGTGGSFVGILVASSDADAGVQAAAGAAYTCDGTSDQVQINAALVQAANLASQGGPTGGAARGMVVLSGGRFFCDQSILMPSGTRLTGNGRMTQVLPVALSAVTGAGANPALIKLSTVEDHLVCIDNFMIDMNAGAGGTGHGINLDMTGATSSGWSGQKPFLPGDSDHQVFNMVIGNGNNAARHYIWMYNASGTTHNRGNIIYGCQLRLSGGNAIRLDGASDVLVSTCHIGGSSDYNYYIGGGNTMLFGCKSFFSDTGGFFVSSSRPALTGCTSQDDLLGYNIISQNATVSSCIADTSSTDGFIFNANGISASALNVYNRSGGRYATTTRAYNFQGPPLGCVITGVFDPTNVTTPVSGLPAANNWVRLANGDTGALSSVGA